MATCFLIDIDKCLNCGACNIVCRHHLGPHGVVRRRLISIENENRKQMFSISCHHCAAPACMSACDQHCIRRIRSGAVVLDNKNCSGCGDCAAMCLFGAISIEKTHHKADKCDLCYRRLQRGLSPYCVEACPTGALRIGDTENVPHGYEPSLQGYYIKAATGPSTHYRTGKQTPRESWLVEWEEKNADS